MKSALPNKSILQNTKLTDIKSVVDLKRVYPEQFDSIVNFSGKAKLLLKDDAVPFIDAPRKCPVHIRELLKSEIEKMVAMEVIKKVEEHTDWCSSLAYSTKKDGSLRICLDPQKLNDSLKRCPHKTPTVEELNPEFANAKVFSKLDAKTGYCSVHLEEESQLLTTFRTPFGRYCWRRLPFGLKVSQDIFQAKMDQIVESLPGVACIADDIVVHGKDERSHDENMIKLMNRATQRGLVFNSKKCFIKKDSISFFGNTYTAKGIQPDSAKISDIQNMPTPSNKEDLQRFLGMTNYLAQFIPRYADKAHTLRTLLKKDVPWTWDICYQKCFEELKQAISESACLKYYDTTLPVQIEVDASLKGLGVALVQEGRPVAFGSKSLNECQSNYSNIEREMLAVVYGILRYHTFLYGRSFTVVTDHKPLVTICTKPIHAAPPRLQRMLLKIQGYSYSIEYRPGADMVLADTLSRLPNPKNDGEVELDLRVDTSELDFEDPEHMTIAVINFPLEKQQVLREETARDPVLNELKSIVYQGWPDNIKQLPTDLRPYWAVRDELAVEAGVLFKGRRILIPKSMQEDIMSQLHEGHQGIEKTRRLARESVYWVNINSDIKKLCKSCGPCQEYQESNKREPLIPHEVPTRPWQFIASDLFEINHRQYLLTVDRYSQYPLVDAMPTVVSSQAVVKKIKMYCALFGRPDEIMTDNGPQYAAETFKTFTKEWGIVHITSSPHYARSNGFIERHVRHVKPIIRKGLKQGDDIQRALLNLRATPVDTRLPSPGEMLFGRPMTTLLPSHGLPGPEDQRQHMVSNQTYMKEHHDQSSGPELLPLYPGQQSALSTK
jgi:hypothetical protein